MHIILTVVLAFLLVFTTILLFRKLLFEEKKISSWILKTLDNTFIIWSTSLFFYSVVFGKTTAFISSLSRSFYLLLNLFLAVAFLLVIAYVQSDKIKMLITVKKKENRSISKAAKFLIGFYAAIIFVSLLLYTSSAWLIDTFGPVNIDQLLYSMQNLSGTNTDQVFTFIDKPLIISTVITYLFVRLVQFFSNYSLKFGSGKREAKQKPKAITRFLLPFAVFTTFTASVLLSVNNVGFAQIKLYFEKSSLFEREYIDTKEVELTFPEQKRNLIYIFAESMEASYTSVELGGNQEHNLLQELTDLLDEGAINFSNTDKVGGAQQVPGTDYTAAGIVSQTSGIPLKAPTSNRNNFGDQDSYSDGEAFLPGITSLGELLGAQGYNQSFVMGSNASFGGRRTYLDQHGDYDILDVGRAVELGLIPSGYVQWWGYEDEKLFQYAQDEATRLYEEGEPFNLTMLTADTHFPDGYLADKPTPYDNQYANVVAYSSKQIADFIKWCSTQPFYENTTIIVTGDHLTMDQKFIDEYLQDYDRTIFNLFINSPIDPDSERVKNRQFTSMDLFPTTLASLNVTIAGERLGLGTNLFSNRKTIVENSTLEDIQNQLSQQSDFYNEHILKFDPDNYKSQKEEENSTTSSTTTALEETVDSVTSVDGVEANTPAVEGEPTPEVPAEENVGVVDAVIQ
ncbi:LTA synthase family protein [Enterococcus larvae]|uniref:LTA synthase family protein n=1 Tax=Enterococcus larvae TaxID=2794352 RepID=UPI003F2D6836